MNFLYVVIFNKCYTSLPPYLFFVFFSSLFARLHMLVILCTLCINTLVFDPLILPICLYFCNCTLLYLLVSGFFFFFTTLYAYFSLYYTLWVSVYLFCHFIYISEIFYVYFIFEFYTELIVPFVAARRTIFEYLRLFGSVIIENTAIYII